MRRLVRIVILCWGLSLGVAAEEIVATLHNASSVYLMGDAYSVNADYEQTATNKGHLTAGKSLTLRLYDLPKGQLTRIALGMRSNQSAGAGTLTMTMNENPIWSIPNSPFSSPFWHGSFSTEYVVIEKTLSATLEGEILLTIEATENSLYWQSLTLTYTPAPREPATVTLVSQAADTQQLTESQAGSGIILPSLPNIEGWNFVGWVTEPIVDAEYAHLDPAGTGRYPQANETLYAVYASSPIYTLLPEEDLPSGVYAILTESAGQMMIAQDWPEEGLWSLAPQAVDWQEDGRPALSVISLPENCRYEIVREGDSLRLKIANTDLYIGYSNTGRLELRNRLWAATKMANGSWAMHTTLNGQIYVLFSGLKMVHEDYIEGLMLRPVTALAPEVNACFLYPVESVLYQTPATRYTTYPLGYTALERVEKTTIQDGVYTPDGRRVGDSLHSLPHGLYILQQGTQRRKVWY